jgi:hypothetical protein
LRGRPPLRGARNGPLSSSRRSTNAAAPSRAAAQALRRAAHDALHRLTSFKRGDLDNDKDAITTNPPVREQSWTLQHVGNWGAVVSKTNGSDDSPYDARTHSKDNEIVTIDPQGAIGSFTVVHDAAGNLKELPDRTDLSKAERYSYDYRNRLIKIEHSDE